jgi:alpha-ketoglutarate-dependent taurine dioxygenase
MDDKLQMELADRLGKLTGKPSDSGLHIHPISNFGREHRGNDYEINIISSVALKKLYKNDPSEKKQNSKVGWHSDINFEPVPADYTILRLVELPGTGGGRTRLSFRKISNLLSFVFRVDLHYLT